MKPRYAMVLDSRLCVGCSACVIGCKAENNVPEGGFRDWVVDETRGSFPNLTHENRSERCNHCEIAPCVINCPTGASYVSPEGVVLVDAKKCTGCKNCMSACPYDARYVDHERNVVDKCTFCTHRTDGKTSCQIICPTGCISYGDVSDPDSEVSRLLASRRWKVLKPEAGTKPKVYYLL
jgi:Fe-S-cluster-containing dehydrogenase component